jgi:hypothetical protein
MSAEEYNQKPPQITRHCEKLTGNIDVKSIEETGKWAENIPASVVVRDHHF